MSESPEALLARADKKATKGPLSFLSGGPRFDEAAQLYATAGNKYKLDKKYKEAAECFVKVAWMNEKMADSNGEARAYEEAASLTKKISPSAAMQYYEKAIHIFNTHGRFSQSAKLQKSLAESFEEGGEMRKAAECYKKAAEYNEMDEHGKSAFTAAITKYADLISRVDQTTYRECIKIYETEGQKALRNTLLQFGAKEHFLKAGILLLVLGDPIDAKISVERYEELDPRFAGAREGKLLRNLVLAYEGGDKDGFVEHIREYDSISKLDGWKVHFLNKAKDALTPADEKLREDSDDDLT